MNNLKLGHIRIKEIIEPSTIYTAYRRLVMDYFTELVSDYKNSENEPFYQYYKGSYEKLMHMCNVFLDTEYELNIPFTNACKLYNYMSEEFDKNLVFDGKLTKKLIDSRTNFIHMELATIINSIFTKRETKEDKIKREFKLLDDLSTLLSEDEAADLDKYINICRNRAESRPQVKS